MSPGWNLQVYERPDGTNPYLTFRQGLSSYQRLVLDAAVERILAREGNNVCSTEWGKALGQGLYEFRIRRTLRTILAGSDLELPAGVDPDQKILLRVFFSVEGARVVLLLAGYDKGKDPSPKRQDREIRRARSLLAEHLRTQH